MTPAAVLEIIRLLLELANKIHDDVPPTQRAQFWTDHAKRMAFWEDLFSRLAAGVTLPAVPGTLPKGDQHG